MPDAPEGWVTTGEAIRISGYGRARLYQLRGGGKIQYWKIGRTVLYRRDEMEQLREGRKSNPQEVKDAD